MVTIIYYWDTVFRKHTGSAVSLYDVINVMQVCMNIHFAKKSLICILIIFFAAWPDFSNRLPNDHKDTPDILGLYAKWINLVNVTRHQTGFRSDPFLSLALTDWISISLEMFFIFIVRVCLKWKRNWPTFGPERATRGRRPKFTSANFQKISSCHTDNTKARGQTI